MSIRPCSNATCTETYSIDDDDIPFVRVVVGGYYYMYCCPRCAVIDPPKQVYPPRTRGPVGDRNRVR